ncbi:tautomerase family protein [Prosthecomicrobium hirschii]|uniref:tautomerase family protein n=1 Tax=Prosthecodimorpha hirschii TaxID=665126 RepID=UPI00112D6D99|nr:tautomerase family protein [Prosthecomicrobium hirschii]TPQ50410.1 tautomerase family protein [Prosthecomicrobium hirschii]
MPLVRIDVPATLAAGRVRGLADAVHQALVATAGVPAADRFHVVARHAADGLTIDPTYLGVERSAEAAIVAITFRRGRTDDQKRALYRAIADGAAERAGLRPQDVMVVVIENGPADWSFGDGLAQYAPG